MEAPDKIYLAQNILGDVIEGLLQYHKLHEDDIEYIRTAAFIEKAAMFFEENIEEEDCKFGCSEWVELRSNYESLDSFIRAFIKYIKEK